MKTSTWIGIGLGWFIGGPFGAIIGGFIGSAFGGEDSSEGSSSHAFSGSNSNDGNRNSFLMSMLVLAAHIIKADGRIMHSEMELMRQWLRANFGDVAIVKECKYSLGIGVGQETDSSLEPPGVICCRKGDPLGPESGLLSNTQK